MELEDSQSWKDRCDRYFHSLVDSEDKDGDQEKDMDPKTRPNGQPIQQSSAAMQDIDDEWKMLSQLQSKSDQRMKPGSFKLIRKVLSGLDVHGARFAAKSPNNVELVMWVMIVLAAVGAAAFLVYLQISQFFITESSFHTVSVGDPVSSDYPTVSFCNMNPIKKSLVAGTRFDGLLNVDKDASITISSVEPQLQSVHEILKKNNPRILEFIQSVAGTRYSDILDALGQEHAIRNTVTSADIVSLYELSLGGQGPSLLWDLVVPSTSEMLELGSTRTDLLVQCIIGGRVCRESEIAVVQGRHGNCITVAAESAGKEDLLEVILDTQTDEYINSLAQTIGVTVNLQDSAVTEQAETMSTASPGNALFMNIQQVTETTRKEGGCNSNPTYSRQDCLTTCLKMTVKEHCSCGYRTGDRSNTSRCSYKVFPQYVCLRAVLKLDHLDMLPCSCPPRCRNLDYNVMTSTATWPSDGNMIHVLRSLSNPGRNTNASFVRSNYVKVAVNMAGARKVTSKETPSTTLLDLLAHIGGLLAIIVGVSLLSIAEILWTLVRVILQGGKLLKKQSKTEFGRQKLTDSEITSITWNLHRERRHAEEVMESRQREQNQKTSDNIGTGNVLTRISVNRRNVALHPITEERHTSSNYVARPHSTNAVQSAPTDTKEQNGYRQRYQNNPRNRGSTGSEVPLLKSLDSRDQAPSRSSKKHDHLNNSRQNLLPSVDNYVHSGNNITSNSYTDDRVRTPTSSIRLYGGSSAYFHSNSVTEPMYL